MHSLETTRHEQLGYWDLCSVYCRMLKHISLLQTACKEHGKAHMCSSQGEENPGDSSAQTQQDLKFDWAKVTLAAAFITS